MAEMTMIEEANGDIKWECSECLVLLKDKKQFEEKVKKCQKCGADIDKFNNLFDEDGE